MAKTVMRLLLSGIFLTLTVIMVLLGKYATALIFSFYPDFSRQLLGSLSKFFALFPVAMWELAAVLLILWFIYTFLRAFAQIRILRWFSGVILTCSIFAAVFVAIWGLNYYAPPMYERLELSGEQYSVEQLKEATAYYRDMANQTAALVERDESGAMIDYNFDTLAKQAGDGFAVLAQTMPCFDGSTAPVKELLSSPLMAATGTTGIFIAFTGESGVSNLTYSAALPFTMCHEIGHRMAFAREDEANFAGFLACSVNENPVFQYSGYYMAFRYCYNALYKIDQSAANDIWAGVSSYLAADCNASAKHYEEVRSESISAVADVVYDSYLKTFDVESGVQSYGEVADLLLMWYFERVR